MSLLSHSIVTLFLLFQPKQTKMSSINVNWQLFNACNIGNLQEVKRLLAAGADVNAYTGTRPVNVATDRAHVDVVRVLLDNRADIDGTDSIGYDNTFVFHRYSYFLST